MTTMTFAFIVEGHGVEFAATLDLATIAPPLVPRLDPDAYRAAWVKAAAEEIVWRAAREVRRRLDIPPSCRIPAFIACRGLKIFQ